MLLDERPCASGGLALSALTSTTYDSSSKKLSTAGSGLRGVGLTSRSLGGTANICLRQGDGTLYDLSYRVLVGLQGPVTRRIPRATQRDSVSSRVVAGGT